MAQSWLKPLYPKPDAKEIKTVTIANSSAVQEKDVPLPCRVSRTTAICEEKHCGELLQCKYIGKTFIVQMMTKSRSFVCQSLCRGIDLLYKEQCPQFFALSAGAYLTLI